MDKLSEHAIRMLEIADKPYWNEYNMVNKDLKDTHDIARAVYDLILQVQILKMADRKTEPNSSEKPNNCDDCIWSVCNYNKVPWDKDDEPLDKDTNVRSKDCETCLYKGECGWESWYKCPYKPQTEPQTDEEYINNLPWTEVGNGEQTERSEK